MFIACYCSFNLFTELLVCLHFRFRLSNLLRVSSICVCYSYGYTLLIGYNAPISTQFGNNTRVYFLLLLLYCRNGGVHYSYPAHQIVIPLVMSSLVLEFLRTRDSCRDCESPLSLWPGLVHN